MFDAYGKTIKVGDSVTDFQHNTLTGVILSMRQITMNRSVDGTIVVPYLTWEVQVKWQNGYTEWMLCINLRLIGGEA